MWNSRLAARGRLYADAVLSVVGPDGYPASVRCRIGFDDRAESIRIAAPPLAASWRGPACLLLHRHNDELEDFHELQIRGRLRIENADLILRPSAFVTGSGSASTDRMPHAGAPFALIHFIRIGRRQAARYLARRGRPWPAIDFGPLQRAVKEVDAERRAASTLRGP